MKKNLFLYIFLLANISLFAQPDTAKIRTDSSDANSKIPIYTVTSSDDDNDLESQDASALLQGSRDAFTSMAGYNLSTGHFRIRGLAGENQLVMINGIPVNNLESGIASWSNWGGLNDVTRFMEVRVGMNPCRYNFGGIAGYTNIDSRASAFKKGTKFSYALSNRNYHQRFMFSQSTGLNKKGWALSYALSGRYAQKAYYDGTFFNAASYYIAVDKKINDKHLLSLVGFGAPITQGRQGMAVEEAYSLTGNHYYNPNWGYQTSADGTQRLERNARVSTTHKPTALLTHHYTINDKSKLTSTLYYSYGKNGLTNLNWFDAKNPHPDYYKYLPSYYAQSNPSYSQELASLWASDPNTSQINWDYLYDANRNNLYSQENANGTGVTEVGRRSKYIVENVHTDSKDLGLNTVYNARVNRVFISTGINATIHKGHYYKTVEDLLGGDYWVDIDQFANQQYLDPIVSQNDLTTPNKVVKKGDKFGYDYVLNVNKAEAFGQVEYTVSKFDLYAGLNLGHTTIWRTGNFKNGRFPDNSLGDSKKANFLTYGFKGGASYKIIGRHIIIFNAAYVVRPPDSRSLFVTPRANNNLVNGYTNENVTSGDLNYIVRYSRLKIRATAYYTTINNQIWSRSYWHDEFRNNVNYVLTGVNMLMYGTELGIDANITQQITFQGAFGTGSYLWNSRPTATITRDNSAAVLDEGRVAYMKNYHIGNMPETVGSIGLKFSGKKYWYVGGNFNYFAKFYVEPNPDRRTEEALSTYVTDDPQWSQLLTQQKLPNQYTVDLYAGKSIRLKSKYYLNINLNVNNVLNNTNFIFNAMEQLRYNNLNPNQFANKYTYQMGINYFLLVSFRF